MFACGCSPLDEPYLSVAGGVRGGAVIPPCGGSGQCYKGPTHVSHGYTDQRVNTAGDVRIAHQERCYALNRLMHILSSLNSQRMRILCPVCSFMKKLESFRMYYPPVVSSMLGSKNKKHLRRSTHNTIHPLAIILTATL